TEQFQNLKASEAAVKASLEAYELYEVRYQSGLINLIELLQLQKILQDTERNYLSALHVYWTELLNQTESIGSFSFLLNAIKK
ncbi:MAG: TolC family protein, partial [Ginsengibacter sp.]